MKTMKGLEVRAAVESYGRDIGIRIANIDSYGQVSVVEKLDFVAVDEDAYTSPTFALRREQAQQLMDELWNCGLRPTEGSGSAGSLAATERHLKDMQAVAFGLLKRQGVER